MAQGQLTEDDLYRTSTQFRLWSFSPEELAKTRQQTHDAAITRATSYLPSSTPPSITLEDEYNLVQRYCEQIRTTSDFFGWPINVKATAVQYLKRFYLTNSCLTYPPKDIYKSVLFLASKTEGVHQELAEYARRISTDPKLILAPEYKIIQALRFTLDVRQPNRGLKGMLMELLNMVEGTCEPIAASGTAFTSGADVQRALLALDPPAPASQSSWVPTAESGPQASTARIHAAYGQARQILDAPALLTDVFFLYTPPQIALGALSLSDPVLADFLLSTKLPPTEGHNDDGHGTAALAARIRNTISSCAKLLSGFTQADVLTKEQRNEIETRLESCRDPATRDLVAGSAKIRRGGGDENGVDGVQANGPDDEEKKRKRLEREASFKKQGDDLFGPSL